MEKQDRCLKNKSGKSCIADTGCIVTWGGRGFICVNQKYATGGIGINVKTNLAPTQPEITQCHNVIQSFEFPGYANGCTTDGGRSIHICCDAVKDCCTPNVDICY